MRSEPSGKEVLDRKNDLGELCREGCGRHESCVVEPVRFSVKRSIGARKQIRTNNS